MEEHLLKILSIICSVAGLGLIFFISTQINAVVDIDTITIDDVGIGTNICGAITSKRMSNNHLFLDITDDTGSIRFVMFNTTALKLNETGISPYSLEKGTRICAPGVVDEYPKGSGKLEMVYRHGMIEIV